MWLIYITVEDLEASLGAAEKHGGEVLTPVRDMGGYGRMAVVRDPAGAVAALIQPTPPAPAELSAVSR